MNLEKSKKRIAKKCRMGFQGYPHIILTYFGASEDLASEVRVEFIAKEGAASQEQRFSSKDDVREDAAIQSALVKMMERSEVKSVSQTEGVLILT